ncbi:MAG: prolipoprotein diacylglyceryl transferase [Chthonomonadales bacterium]|nr:prolipoprotein diacylglyceryl transferase [Chthonomonadales bacterium]
MHPILFKLGPITVRSYGVLILVGFLLALWYAMAAARRRMAGRAPGAPGVVTPEHVFDAAVVGLPIGILGTRLLYVALNWGAFRDDPLSAFKLWEGGLSFMGAFLAFFYLAWYCRKHRLSFLEMADLTAPGFALAYAFGRIGCFLNGCCYGHPCELPWAVRFPDEHTAGMLTPPSHPAQLYATLINLAMFVVLDRWSRVTTRRGELLTGYLLLYCAYRFVIEEFRRGATAAVYAFGLTQAQLFCAAAIPVLVLALWRIRARPAPVTAGEVSAEVSRSG